VTTIDNPLVPISGSVLQDPVTVAWRLPAS
jgi:hypothetical protein